MAQHRTNHRSASAQHSPVIQRRKLAARRVVSGSRRRAFSPAAIYPTSHASVASSASSSSPPSARAVLVPVHFNLRRLPSRTFKQQEVMHDAVEIGSKRKRVVSGSENIQTNSHGVGGRVKRRRAAPDSSDEESTSMDVDEPSRWGVSDGSESEGASDSCKCHLVIASMNSFDRRSHTAATYLISEAAPRELLRQRKDQLVRLYQLAGLTDDAELLTKHEIVDSIVAARDELAPLPPSSPPGAMDSGSSDYSSDGGNVAGGEETDFGYRLRNGLRRRATVHDMSHSVARPGQERCYSLGELDGQRLRTKALPQRKGSLQYPTRR